MGCCLLVVLAMLMPRGLLLFLWILTDWVAAAYQTWYWPLLGLLFAPYTTLAYMAAMLNNNHTVSGWWLALVVLAVLTDLGVWSGGKGSKSRRRRVRA
jgi:hypothetical protein